MMGRGERRQVEEEGRVCVEVSDADPPVTLAAGYVAWGQCNFRRAARGTTEGRRARTACRKGPSVDQT